MDAQEVSGRYYWPGIPGVPEHPMRAQLAKGWGVGRQEEGGLDPGQEGHTNEPNEVHLWARRVSVKCQWCGVRSHFNKDCKKPHSLCQKTGYCRIRNDHDYYYPRCGFPKTRGGTMPGKKLRRSRRHTVEDDDSGVVWQADTEAEGVAQ